MVFTRAHLLDIRSYLNRTTAVDRTPRVPTGNRAGATASGTVGDADLGTLLAADLTRADQGEIVVQHQLD